MTQQKEVQVAEILKKLSEELKIFPKDTAQLMYARQLAGTDISIAAPEDTGTNARKAGEASQRLNKMMEEAKLKWNYASDTQKNQVMEMEELIRESNDQIRKLYEQQI